MSNRQIRPNKSLSVLRELTSRRGKRVSLATDDIFSDNLSFNLRPRRHVIQSSAIDTALALSSQQTYSDKKYKLVLGGRRLDVPRKESIPIQKRPRKRWQRSSLNKNNQIRGREGKHKSISPAWQTSSLPSVSRVSNNLSKMKKTTETFSWKSPWQRYRFSRHKKYVPASQRNEFFSVRRNGSLMNSHDMNEDNCDARFVHSQSMDEDQHPESLVDRRREVTETKELSVVNGRSAFFRIKRPVTSWERSKYQAAS